MTTSTLTKCPDWCTLEPGHDWDSEHFDGTLSRGHAGPKFGKYVGVDGIEVDDLRHKNVIVDLRSETLLLVDAGLDHAERMELLTRAMGQVQA